MQFAADREERDYLVVNASYVLFTIAVTVLSIINSILLLFPFTEASKEVILTIDNGISAFLLLDFFARLLRARDRRRFLITYHGWLLFLGSLPLPFVRVLRLLAYWLVARKLKRAEVHEASQIVLKRRAQSTLLAVVLATIVVFELAGVMILNAEAGAPDANIRTASDALWWAYVSVTTVGYGDKFPTTATGRIVGVLLMAVGIGIFSAVTSFLTDWFQRPRVPRAVANASLEANNPFARIELIRNAITELDRQHSSAIAELQGQLDELERLLK